MPQDERLQAYLAYQDLINYKLATPPYTILEDAYGREFDHPHDCAYRDEKLFLMKKDFLIWMNTLDTQNFRRLITAVQVYANRIHQLTGRRIPCINQAKATYNKE
jgi:hypothetical protein